MELAVTEIRNILTRTTGFLKTVTSHSMQPYRGCSFGNALCGVGCYVQHNPYATQGRPWGSFLEVRKNGADSYRLHVDRERRWARKSRGKFSVFLSSSTEPVSLSGHRKAAPRDAREPPGPVDPSDPLPLGDRVSRLTRENTYGGVSPAVGTRSDTRLTLAEARRLYLDRSVRTEPDAAWVAGAPGGLEEQSSESATTRVSNPRQ